MSQLTVLIQGFSPFIAQDHLRAALTQGSLPSTAGGYLRVASRPKKILEIHAVSQKILSTSSFLTPFCKTLVIFPKIKEITLSLTF